MRQACNMGGFVALESVPINLALRFLWLRSLKSEAVVQLRGSSLVPRDSDRAEHSPVGHSEPWPPTYPWPRGWPRTGPALCGSHRREPFRYCATVEWSSGAVSSYGCVIDCRKRQVLQGSVSTAPSSNRT